MGLPSVATRQQHCQRDTQKCTGKLRYAADDPGAFATALIDHGRTVQRPDEYLEQRRSESFTKLHSHPA